MTVLKYYRHPALSLGSAGVILLKLQEVADKDTKYCIKAVESEHCFYVQLANENKEISAEEGRLLQWVLSVPFHNPVTTRSMYSNEEGLNKTVAIEIGPRLNFCTAFSTNATAICHSIGLTSIKRIERSTRYFIEVHSPDEYPTLKLKEIEERMVDILHDRMTHCRYESPPSVLDLLRHPDEVFEVDVIGAGKKALADANVELGLALDEWDLDYYTQLFATKVQRNPTSVECFDLAQSNSEHSRHWFFKGRLVIDGKEVPDSLFDLVMGTQKHTNPNNVIKFSDNSSAIEGFPVSVLSAEKPVTSIALTLAADITRHIIFTAETHNFPTGVAPFPGATTGTGGRIRDVQAAGRGAHVIAGIAGYCVGNLNIPGYELPWEDSTFTYPKNFARPLDIIVEASDGASDYGNKFGEPVLAGFTRSFGMDTGSGQRREWIKPIMFSGGIGSIDSRHVKKEEPEKDMVVVKIGGPVYRIGVGGGAASSIHVQGDNESELDLGAVQRGDAEMEQKVNRVVRACIEMGEHNPICSIHDQGAGGNGNVLKEICEPSGAVIQTGAFELGDPTLSVLELWGAEYQESNAALLRPLHKPLLQQIADREKCPVCFVGHITGDGRIRLEDTRCSHGDSDPAPKRQKKLIQTPVDLDLELVLGQMPRKTFQLDHEPVSLPPLTLPDGLIVHAALGRVLRLPSVGSKRYLTNKVDRSVTGLVAQQQCVGPLHTPLADVAVVALSHFNTVGGATAVGEQPIKGLVDAECGARMAVAEALTNLVFAKVTALKDVKCSGNWMWPAKLPGQGALLYDACRAMCDVMGELGVAVDGGKDSLSMAARVGTDTVMAPGALVVSAYVGCPDVTLTVTPDLKCPDGSGALLYIPLSKGRDRLGGSALAQCFNQLGNVSPDLDDPGLFVRAFDTSQTLIAGRLLDAGHDVSDGGLVTCLLEMAFAGNCGLRADIPRLGCESSPLEILFAEELGLVVEVKATNQDTVCQIYEAADVPCYLIGSSVNNSANAEIAISVDGKEVLRDSAPALRDVWEETSYRLELRQADPGCVRQEREGLRHRPNPPFTASRELLAGTPPSLTPQPAAQREPWVAVIREEGSNGDREMGAAFLMAGFRVYDVTMRDLISGQTTLESFQGVAFVGGFSYADVFGSAKGWAATLKFNPTVQAQFDAFFKRRDTFSLGVCNGCQLMALLGWVAPDTMATDAGAEQGVYLARNLSERFESRFTTVTVTDSPAIMLEGMARATLGIWVAHGEGRMTFKNEATLEQVMADKLAPILYVDDQGQPTSAYPHNPNGSPRGVAALCSPDGRHLALMPHPERCVLPWQWPWMPNSWRNGEMKTSPWLRMFQNAYQWCREKC